LCADKNSSASLEIALATPAINITIARIAIVRAISHLLDLSKCGQILDGLVNGIELGRLMGL
jgi:hypothetical protein